MSVSKINNCLKGLMIIGALTSGYAIGDERISYAVINNSSESVVCVEVLSKALDDSIVSSIKQDIEKNIKNTKKIQGVEFLRAYQLGSYVNVDVIYKTADKKIQWREDYSIEGGKPIRLQDAKFHQFYELTYLKLKENQYKKCNFPAVNSKDIQIIDWSGPVEASLIKLPQESTSNITWRLLLKRIDVTIEKKESVWKVSDEKSKFARAFFKQILDSSNLNNNSSLIKPVYFRTELDSSGKYKQVQLESKERMRDYISKWNFVHIIGVVNNGNKGFVYFSVKENSNVKELQYVFQYEMKSNEYIFNIGVNADYDSAILSSTAILDSLVKTNE